MKNILHLLILIIAHAATFNYTTADIQINLIINTTINTLPTSDDTCRQILVKNQQVYHLNTQDLIQTWNKTNLNSTLFLNTHSQLSIITGNLIPSKTITFGIDENQTSLIYFQAVTFFGYSLTYLINPDHTVTSSSNYYYFIGPNQIFINFPYIYEFYTYPSPNIIVKGSLSNTNYYQLWLAPSFINMALSPNFNIIIFWTSLTQCSIYRAPQLTFIETYIPSNKPNSTVTNTITFSSDSAFAIIETDQFNPIVVLNLTDYNFSVAYSVPINDTIIEAHFLDATNTVLVVFCLNSVTFVDLQTNQQYITPPITATAYAADYHNNIFTCYNNTMSSSQISFTRKSQNQITSSQKTFDQIFNFVNGTVEAFASQVCSTTNIISSSPISVYFLGFLNYLTACSLYVLLNSPIPQHVNQYLTLLLTQMNINLFQIIGFSFNIQSLSDQKVDSSKLLYFGVTTDLVSGTYSNFAVLFINYLIMTIVYTIFVRICNNRYILKTFSLQKTHILSGQLINILQPLILPWIFIFFKQGNANSITLLNQGIYILLLGICLIFLFYYFLKVQKQYKTKQIESAIKQCFHAQGKKSIGRIRLNRKQYLKYKINSLLYIGIAEQLYLAFTNIIFPLLIVLDNPSFFLIIISFYDALGIFISFNSTNMRINKFILSIYPFVFHNCFLLFRWCNSSTVISFTEIVCILFFCLGLCHNIFTVLFITMKALLKFTLFMLPKNQIQPLTQKSKGKSMIKTKAKAHKKTPSKARQNLKQNRCLQNNKKMDFFRDGEQLNTSINSNKIRSNLQDTIIQRHQIQKIPRNQITYSRPEKLFVLQQQKIKNKTKNKIKNQRIQKLKKQLKFNYFIKQIKLQTN